MHTVVVIVTAVVVVSFVATVVSVFKTKQNNTKHTKLAGNNSRANKRNSKLPEKSNSLPCYAMATGAADLHLLF